MRAACAAYFFVLCRCNPAHVDQHAATELGYDEDRWDNGPAPETDKMYWMQLTESQREACMAIGYTKELWDKGGYGKDKASPYYDAEVATATGYEKEVVADSTTVTPVAEDDKQVVRTMGAEKPTARSAATSAAAAAAAAPPPPPPAKEPVRTDRHGDDGGLNFAFELMYVSRNEKKDASGNGLDKTEEYQVEEQSVDAAMSLASRTSFIPTKKRFGLLGRRFGRLKPAFEATNTSQEKKNNRKDNKAAQAVKGNETTLADNTATNGEDDITTGSMMC